MPFQLHTGTARTSGISRTCERFVPFPRICILVVAAVGDKMVRQAFLLGDICPARCGGLKQQLVQAYQPLV
jgi:hypothetical protein